MSLSSLKVINLPIDQLVAFTNNARTHSKKQIALIAKSIKEFGFNDPIAIDAMNGIIAGHGRVKAALSLGITEVPTIQLGHLSKDQIRAYIIAHNRIALDAGWDEDLLQLELHELKEAGFDISLTGFSDREIDKFINSKVSLDGLGDKEATPDPMDSIVTIPGDCWVLGNHRLLCGDSTNPIDVQNLTKEFNPILMITDPPYGVNYEPEWREEASKRVGETSKGKVDNDNTADWTAAYRLFAGDILYVWHASIYCGDIATHLKNCDFSIVSQIIWVKQHFAISRGDYHWQHELCWYAVRNGKKHNWQGARDQATTWFISNNNAFGNANPEKTWGRHGTQKPIECMSRPILNNTEDGDYIYDPFGGSGTTLIAAENYHRNCLMMEISPNYCDVIIKRWQEFTSKKAILEANGSSFEEIQHGRKKGATLKAVQTGC